MEGRLDEPETDDADDARKTASKGPNWPNRWPGSVDTLNGEPVDRFDDREIGSADT